MKIKKAMEMLIWRITQGSLDNSFKEGSSNNPLMQFDASEDKFGASYHADLNDKTGFLFEGSSEVYIISSENNNEIKTQGEEIFQKSISTKNPDAGTNSFADEIDAASDTIGNNALIGASKAGQAGAICTSKKAFETKTLNNKANSFSPVFFIIINLFLFVINYKCPDAGLKRKMARFDLWRQKNEA